MLQPRRCASFILLGLLVPALTLAAHSFENTAVVRTVELGGSLVHVTTTYAVKALEDDASLYAVALSENEHENTSWREAKIKGQSAVLPMKLKTSGSRSGAYTYELELPRPLKTNATLNVVVDTIQTHATYPWPKEAAQADTQSLKYETDLFVLSPYQTIVQRTKFRSPSPQIHSYTTPDGLEAFTTESPVTKSGSTITYGPYHDIAPSATEGFLQQTQKHIVIHYQYDHPVIDVAKLERTAEISHWGSNLNIQDNVHLKNAGPSLKGHFSRLEYQSQNYFGRRASHIIPQLTFHLPAGIHDVYYYDVIGNVSTSHLRPAPSVPKGSQSNQYSVFEFRPRYPLLGGWNYSFTLGWDSPLADYAGWDKQSGKYIVGIPFMTLIPGAVVDEAEVKLILPEGATDIEFWTPFPAIENVLSTHISYLDTTGRPAISLYYQRLTNMHVGTIYVAYKVPFSAHLKKPIAVATAFFGLFALSFVWRRVDIRLQK